MKFPGFSDDEELIFKFVLKDITRSETEHLPKTSEWFQKYKLLPQIGNTIIPLDSEQAKKPFCIVNSIVWDTHTNEVVIVLEGNAIK